MRLALFVLVAGLLDWGVGWVLSRLYFRQRSGTFAQCTYIMDGVKDPVLIVGSSRALHHYISTVLSDSLRRPCFNAGRDGQGVIFYDAVLQQVFARYKPDLVVLDLNPRELEPESKSYDRLSELLPYLHTHPTLQRVVDLRGPFERLKRISRIYPYNSMLFAIVLHNLPQQLGAKRERGFLPLYGHAPGHRAPTGEHARLSAHHVDPLKVAALLHIVEIVRTSGCRLCVVVSPTLSIDRSEEPRELIAKLLAQADVPFWDYSGDPNFLRNAYLFYDESHLNVTGARRFSRLIAARLVATR